MAPQGAARAPARLAPSRQIQHAGDAEHDQRERTEAGRPPNEPFDERDLYAQHQDPFSAFAKSGPDQPPPTGSTRPIGRYDVPEPVIPVAPRQPGAGVTLAVVLAVFALLLGAAIFFLST